MPTRPFTERSYNETPIGQEVEAKLRPMLASLLQRRVVLLTGAGTSTSLPAGLPSGGQLAELLVARLTQMGMQSIVENVDQGDLGQVCDAIEAEIGRAAL